MANENRISVVITADPTGAVTGIRMVGDETEKLGGRTQSLTQRLKSHWAEVSVGIYAAVRAFQSIWGLMEKAAQTDEAMASLDALTRQYGMTAQDLVGKYRAGIERPDRDGGRRQGRGGRPDEGPRAGTTRADRLVVGVFIAHQGRHRIDRRRLRNALPVHRHRPGAGLEGARRHRRPGTEVREVRRHDEQSREGPGDVHRRGRADGAGAGDPRTRSGLRGRPDGAVQQLRRADEVFRRDLFS